MSNKGHMTSFIDSQYLAEIKYPVVLDQDEPAVCATFGCGKHLSLTEQLCGDLCLDCQHPKGFDITKVVKIK